MSRRQGKGGRDVWFHATYNPVYGADGTTVGVVKYATVVTDEKLRQAEHQDLFARHHGRAVGEGAAV